MCNGKIYTFLILTFYSLAYSEALKIVKCYIYTWRREGYEKSGAQANFSAKNSSQSILNELQTGLWIRIRIQFPSCTRIRIQEEKIEEEKTKMHGNWY